MNFFYAESKYGDENWETFENVVLSSVLKLYVTFIKQLFLEKILKEISWLLKEFLEILKSDVA